MPSQVPQMDAVRSPFPRSSLVTLRDRLADPAALTWPVALLYLPINLIGPLLIDPRRVGGPWESWLIVGLLAQVVVMVGLWCGRSITQCARHESTRGWATLVVLVSITVPRAVIVTFAAVLLGLSPQFEWGYRLVSGILIQSVALVTLSVLVSSYRQHQEVVAGLQRHRASLQELSTSLRERLEAIRVDVVAEVHRSIDPQIHEIDLLLDQAAQSGDASVAQGAIARLVDDELRPLSHRLAHDITHHDHESAPPMAGGAPRSWLPVRLPMAILLMPIPMAALAGVSAVSPLSREPWTWEGLAFLLASIALVGAISSAARVTLATWSPRLMVGVLIATVVGAGTLGVTLAILQAGGMHVAAGLMSPAVTLGGVWGALLACYAAVNAQRAETEAELRRAVSELRAITSMLHRRALAARRTLAYVIHGSIQSSLHAAALRLAAATVIDDAMVTEIRNDVRRAVGALEDDVRPHAILIDTLRDIAALWDGTCVVRWTMDHRTLRTLVESPDAAASAADITRECVGNAIRHGGATDIWITLTCADNGIQFTCLDNGCGVPENARVGLGSRMFDEMCVDWSRTRVEGFTQVCAQIAAGKDM